MSKERKSSSRKPPGKSAILSSRTKKTNWFFTRARAAHFYQGTCQWKRTIQESGQKTRGARQSAEEVAHKAAWAAGKNKYIKKAIIGLEKNEKFDEPIIILCLFLNKLMFLFY